MSTSSVAYDVLGGNAVVFQGSHSFEEVLNLISSEDGSLIAQALTDGGPRKIGPHALYVPAGMFKLQHGEVNEEPVTVVELESAIARMNAASLKNAKGYDQKEFLNTLGLDLAKLGAKRWAENYRRFRTIGVYAQLQTDPRLDEHQIGMNGRDFRALPARTRKKYAKCFEQLKNGEFVAVYRMRYPVGGPGGVQHKDVVILNDRPAGKLYLNHVDLTEKADGDEDGDGGTVFVAKQFGTREMGTSKVTHAGPFPDPEIVNSDPFVDQLVQKWEAQRAGGKLLEDTLKSVEGMMAKYLVGISTYALNYCLARLLALTWWKNGISEKFPLPQEAKDVLHKDLPVAIQVKYPDAKSEYRNLLRAAQITVGTCFREVLEQEMDAGKKEGCGLPALTGLSSSLQSFLGGGVTVSEFIHNCAPVVKGDLLQILHAIMAEVADQGMLSILPLKSTLAGALISAGKETDRQAARLWEIWPFYLDAGGTPERFAEDLLKDAYGIQPFWMEFKAPEPSGGSDFDPFQINPPFAFRNGKRTLWASDEMLTQLTYTRKDEESGKWVNEPFFIGPFKVDVQERQATRIHGKLRSRWNKKWQLTWDIHLDLPQIRAVGACHKDPLRSHVIVSVNGVEFFWHPRVMWEKKLAWNKSTRTWTEGPRWLSFTEWFQMVVLKAIRDLSRMKWTGTGYLTNDGKLVTQKLNELVTKELKKLPRHTPGYSSVHIHRGVIVDPEELNSKGVSLNVRLDQISKCLHWVSKEVGTGVGYTNKSNPGMQFSFPYGETGMPAYVLEYHPLHALDPASPKRWAEYDYSDSLRLATLEQVFEAIWKATKEEPVPPATPEALQELLAELPEDVREGVAWTQFVQPASQFPLQVDGMGRSAFLEGRETTVEVMVADVKNVTVYGEENACLDTISACPSALLKLAIVETVEDFKEHTRVEQYRETLRSQGVPVDLPGVFVVTERPIEKQEGLLYPQFRVKVTWPRLDAGKVKFLAPFKGTLNIIPIQFWAMRKEGLVPIDVVVPRKTAVKKEALGAVASGMAVRAGLKTLKHPNFGAKDVVGAIQARLEKQGIDRECRDQVFWLNLHESVDFDFYHTAGIGTALHPRELKPLGEATVVPMPAYRPSQSVDVTSNLFAQSKVELHSAVFADIWPDVQGPEWIQMATEMEEIGRALTAVVQAKESLGRSGDVVGVVEEMPTEVSDEEDLASLEQYAPVEA